ncbi:unnamed protein product, partial [Nesidiocoris tenuis]
MRTEGTANVNNLQGRETAMRRRQRRSDAGRRASDKAEVSSPQRELDTHNQNFPSPASTPIPNVCYRS